MKTEKRRSFQCVTIALAETAVPGSLYLCSSSFAAAAAASPAAETTAVTITAAAAADYIHNRQPAQHKRTPPRRPFVSTYQFN